jgi:hypothetical protein
LSNHLSNRLSNVYVTYIYFLLADDDDDSTPISQLLAKKSKAGKEVAADDTDNSDDDGNEDNIKSATVKQQPAVAKLARGRQPKPFSPTGNHTAII